MFFYLSRNKSSPLDNIQRTTYYNITLCVIIPILHPTVPIGRGIFQFKYSVNPKESEKYKVCNPCFHFYSP